MRKRPIAWSAFLAVVTFAAILHPADPASTAADGFVSLLNGLLGLAFHPRFKENRKYYIKHQIFEDGKIATILVEKLASYDFKQDSGQPSRQPLKIEAVAERHNGGCIRFGPDGFLYLGRGRLRSQPRPAGARPGYAAAARKDAEIDVNHCEAAQEYAIPKDNPFSVSDGIRPEIWASGFREPWRQF